MREVQGMGRRPWQAGLVVAVLAMTGACSDDDGDDARDSTPTSARAVSSSTSAPSTVSTAPPTSVPATAPPTVAPAVAAGCSTPEAAARSLQEAWVRNDLTNAGACAVPSAVATVFEGPVSGPQPGAVFECYGTQPPSCGYAYEGGTIVFTLGQDASRGGWVVQEVAFSD